MYKLIKCLKGRFCESYRFLNCIYKYIFIYFNYNFLQNYKIVSTLFGNYLYSGNNIYIIVTKLIPKNIDKSLIQI